MFTLYLHQTRSASTTDPLLLIRAGIYSAKPWTVRREADGVVIAQAQTREQRIAAFRALSHGHSAHQHVQ